LQASQVIDYNFNFYNDNYQTLAKTSYESGYFPSTDHSGNWNPYFWGEQIENFLGFRFTDEENIQRYGWIRCSVIDSGRTLIIHDYAYEMQPDYPILAGDTISFVNVDEQSSLNATIYSFENNVFININKNSSVHMIIVDLTGNLIAEKEINVQLEIINMNNYPTGIYIVNLDQDDRQLTKKIFIN